ncbi:tetraprenyl-beta-curcumene synthase family protein [Paenibacillus woosongensis]|uniref:Tetraprenyl-beta-curcumene synthase family protein n=1 Tax=Paenibacillus woosongensis TaxID=307580 RepID=A0AA95IDB7_9BACL|nr:tetraprenyl-beta-curcumene synthase family protein [Paenibacillus woosongensis]WHX50855.1 tetraprenyl-beta-curcumene synthase family protein [Paenibacillus woosongensis]
MIELKQSRNQFPREPIRLMSRVYKFILPDVRQELNGWRKEAGLIPDPELRRQALASIETKEFHCQGGAVYAAANLPKRHILIPLIVAFQTISDYLDNLCDRSTSMDEGDFRLLHQSMLDAIDPQAELTDYYALREEREDGGYLHRLVLTCQDRIRELPGYHAAQPFVAELVQLYTDLQVYKHIDPSLREAALLSWWELHQSRAPQLKWNEFAAATGSTLGVFMLFLSASDEHLSETSAQKIQDAYFPYVCGVHIMLDYLIDQAEDEIGGDLNFCSYYDNKETMLQRIVFMVDEARRDVAVLPASSFHVMIIEGLLALYLSDPKVSEQQEIRGVSRQLMRRSSLMRLFFFVNSRWIRKRLK